MAGANDDLLSALDAMDIANGAGPADIGRSWRPDGSNPAMGSLLTRGGQAARRESMGEPPPGAYYNDRGQMVDPHQMGVIQGRNLPAVSAFGAGGVDLMSMGTADELQGARDGVAAREQMRGVMEGAQAAHPYAFLGGQIAGGAALPGAGAGWLRNMMVGAGYGGAYGIGSGTDGRSRTVGMMAGWGAGALGGALASGVGAVASAATRPLGNALRRARLFSGGTLTEEGRRLAQQAGLDPATMSAETARQFAEDAARAANPQEGAAAAPFREFNIPAYRHNVTGTVEDAARFHGAARGGRGPTAEARVRPALEAQQQATRDAAERIATDLGQGNPGDQWDAAAGVSSRLRDLGQEQQDAASAMYRAADQAGVTVPPHIAKGVLPRVQSRMAAEEIDATGLPLTTQVLNRLNRRAQGEGQGVSLRLIDGARKDIGKAIGDAKGEDRRALAIIKEEYDSWVADVIDNQLFNGDEQGFADLADARALFREYARRFRGDDLGSRFIQRAIDADADPDMVAKWLFGAGRLGQGQLNAPVARALKDALGPDSEQWAMVRQAAWRQLAMKPEGTVQPGPQAMSNNIARFFNGPETRSLSQELFSPEERAMMLRYASVLKRMVPPQGAVNHSGSGYEVSRMAQATFRAVMTALATTTQGPAAGMAVQGAGRAAEGALNRAAARGMLQPYARGAGLAVPAAAGLPAGEAVIDPLRDRLRR